MTKERSRRFREKKRLNVLKYVHQVVHSFHFCRVILSTHRSPFLIGSREVLMESLSKCGIELPGSIMHGAEWFDSR